MIKSIKAIQFQTRSGDDLGELLQRLVVIFDGEGKNRGSTIALLGSSSGRFKSSVESIKRRGNSQELAAAESGLTVVRVTAARLKKVLGCAPGQKWQARAKRNGSIRGATIRTGRKARLELRLPPGATSDGRSSLERVQHRVRLQTRSSTVAGGDQSRSPPNISAWNHPGIAYE